MSCTTVIFIRLCPPHRHTHARNAFIDIRDSIDRINARYAPPRYLKDTTIFDLDW